MVVVCIDVSDNPCWRNYGNPYLTLGKCYKTRLITDKICRIIDNTGQENPFIRSRFKLLEDVRNERLEELGI